MITSTANIESDGTFAIKTDSGGGLPEGAYKVRIEGGSGTDGKASRQVERRPAVRQTVPR